MSMSFEGEELERLKEDLRSCYPYPNVTKDTCIHCGEKFSLENTFTPAGWRETRISQLCEKCFDNLVKEDF